MGSLGETSSQSIGSYPVIEQINTTSEDFTGAKKLEKL